MAGLAERHEVVKIIGGFKVSAKDAARNDVVNIEFWRELLDAAALAGVVVACQAVLFLLVPVSPVKGVSTASVSPGLMGVLTNVHEPTVSTAKAPPLCMESLASFVLDGSMAVAAPHKNPWFAERWNRLALLRVRDFCAVFWRPMSALEPFSLFQGVAPHRAKICFADNQRSGRHIERGATRGTGAMCSVSPLEIAMLRHWWFVAIERAKQALAPILPDFCRLKVERLPTTLTRAFVAATVLAAILVRARVVTKQQLRSDDSIVWKEVDSAALRAWGRRLDLRSRHLVRPLFARKVIDTSISLRGGTW